MHALENIKTNLENRKAEVIQKGGLIALGITLIYAGLNAGEFKTQALFIAAGLVLIALRELMKTKQF